MSTLPFLLRLALVCILINVGCRTSSHRSQEIAAEVRAVLDRQLNEWNAGHLSGFMETYAKRDETRFASGGDVSQGWRTVYARYKKKYGDPSVMGHLSFSDLDIDLLSGDAAVAFGRWKLDKEANFSGLFTLVLRKLPDGWRIVHDHTSIAEDK